MNTQQPYHQPATLEEVRTLWIGDLPYWADESYLHSWFAQTAEVSLSLSLSYFFPSSFYFVGSVFTFSMYYGFFFFEFVYFGVLILAQIVEIFV